MKSGMRQIFLETGLRSWLKESFVALAPLSSSRASKKNVIALYQVHFILFLIRYGVGYHLTIVKDDSCDPSQVERAVKSVVSDAEKSTDVGAELSYILPSSATRSFPQLFDELEAKKAALGISSFGISVTTMEEVFIKVGEGVEDERYLLIRSWA